MLASEDRLGHSTSWQIEQWGQDACDYAAQKAEREGRTQLIRVGYDLVEAPITPDCVGSDALIELVGAPDEILVVDGNLLLNEGLQRMIDLLIAAGGTAFNNANAFLGVGDTNTSEAATQTELQATQNAANRFYKGMVASYPQRTNQSCDWRSDFTSTEANFAWAEWTVSAGATTASGSGFLVGTTNLNRKVQALGTKATGTWTLTATITFS